MQIKDLTPNAKNPRTISDEKLKQLKAALEEFGDLSGIVFNRKTKQLVGGHQRRKILDPDSVVTITKQFSKPSKTGTVAEGYVMLGTEKFTYREVSWDKHKEMAANIAANKGAGEWDLPELSLWMKELNSFDVDFDLKLTMFDDDELSEFAGITVAEHTRKNATTGVDEDEVPEKAPARSKLGDAYFLGEHRLMCGDSTEKVLIDRLLGEENIDVVLTDPPYGMNLETEYSNSWGLQSNTSGGIGPRKTKNHRKVIGDDKDFDPSFILETFANADDVLLFGADYFCQRLPKGGSWIVWDKTGGNESLDNTGFQSRFELCWSRSPHRRKIFRSTWIGVAGMSKKDDDNRMHPTQKPVKLCEQILEEVKGKNILDLFGGSGSTLIACEKTNRKCFMMELDPHYCDVIVERWEKYTGKKAKHVPAPKTILKTKAAAQPTRSRAGHA